MSDGIHRCGMCGHPMPKGEEMFQYHGYSGPCPGPPFHVDALPELSDLPELTAEERVAMNAMDMTEILGTWEERCRVAMNAAKRWLRDRDHLRAQLAAAEDALASEIRFRECFVRERNDLQKRLAECQRLQQDLNTIYTVANLTDERDEARAAARWLLPFTINTPHTQAAIGMWPWLADTQEAD